MKKTLVWSLILLIYTAALARLLLFKIDMIHLGRLRFRFASQVGEANYQPFKSIMAYAQGEPSRLIATLNLFGNIALFAPIGLMVPLICKTTNGFAMLALAAAAGLTIETLQVVLNVGIFDIDDVILNGFGVMLGYGVFLLFEPRRRAGRKPG